MTETHFGFTKVSETDKAERVGAVFSAVAQKYDLMNDLMSLGLHRIWKTIAIAVAGIRSDDRILDVAAGTGDLCLALARKIGTKGEVWQTDINNEMLRRGRDRLLDAGVLIPALQCDAEFLPLPSNYFDVVTLAFGLRNMTHKEQALAEIFRVLRPGGKLIVLEFSKIWRPLAPAYDLYSFKILPWLGRRIASNEEGYTYLAESIRMHPDQEMLKEMFITVGFEKVDYFNLTAGVVALHRGYKLR